jgi:hypothetical protein
MVIKAEKKLYVRTPVLKLESDPGDPAGLPECQPAVFPARRITISDIPHDYSLQTHHENLSSLYPNVFFLRECSPEAGAYCLSENRSTLKKGAEAVLELHEPHLEGKTVSGLLSRGKKHVFLPEIPLNDANQRRLKKIPARGSACRATPTSASIQAGAVHG